MTTITFEGGPTTSLARVFSSGSLFAPKVGFGAIRSAHTLVNVVIGGAIVQSDPVITRDDAWLYTADWVSGEAEADSQRDLGLGTVYNSVEDFLSSLPD